MRVATKFSLNLASMLFGLMLVAPVALAGTTNCPVEPASNTPIATGAVLAGANCALYGPGDVDSFVFNANSGDTYQLILAINGAGPVNICLTLYSPSRTQIFSGCTSVGWPNYQNSVVPQPDPTLNATGAYTMVISEASNSGGRIVNYAVSLERIYPFPPNAQQVNLGTQVPGYITPLSDSNAFTFQSLTTGTYQVVATLPSSALQNLCMTVYLPNGTISPGSACTSIGWPNYRNTVQITNILPPQNGASMALLTTYGNDGTNIYKLEVSCVLGTCQ